MMTASPQLGLPRIAADLVVGGPGVKGERSESRSDAVGALDVRADDHTIAAAREAGRTRPAPAGLGLDRLLLSPDEVAELLDVSRSRVYDLMRKRELVSVRIGRCRRIPVVAVQRFVEQLIEDAWLT
jgi:excisionase family DNA binding protein